MARAPEPLVDLPPLLQGIFFDFLWETSKVWALSTPASAVPLSELAWHLELPVWSARPKLSLFDLAPATVLANPDVYTGDWDKILNADLAYPLELFRNGARWVVLDGYHRLARAKLERVARIPVRLHPDELKSRILRDT